jgi:hypothetical protein
MKEPVTARIERKVSSALYRHFLVNFPRRFEASLIPTTVVMPLAKKDLRQAETTLASIRNNLLHPIERIVIPGQSSSEIAEFCRQVGAVYIDEETVLPNAVRTFDYATRDRNRNGWIRQQILKLMSDQFTATQHVLIIDSDTCLVRKVSFVRNGKPILFFSDEHNATYHECNQRLIGPVRTFRRSFVTHCMLFDRGILAGLHSNIERKCRVQWIDAILSKIERNVEAGFSEYELYGTHVYNAQPHLFQAQYWYNAKYRGEGRVEPSKLPTRYRKFNFVSSHVK